MNKIILIIFLVLVGGYAAYATYENMTVSETPDTITIENDNTKSDVIDKENDVTAPETDTNSESKSDGVENTETDTNKDVVENKPDLKNVIDKQALARTLTTKAACEAEGGVWLSSFGLTMYCKLPTTDAGNSCTDSSQCESWCQAPSNTQGGTNVTGSCFGYTSAACSQEVEDGTAGWEQCQMAPPPAE